jgi:uncharacterized protein
MRSITDEKIEHYMMTTGKALELVTIEPDLDAQARAAAHGVLDMAKRYYSDARHFRAKGDLVTAFAAINYAHGWIDCGVRVGLLHGDPEDHRFVMPR